MDTIGTWLTPSSQPSAHEAVAGGVAVTARNESNSFAETRPAEWQASPMVRRGCIWAWRIDIVTVNEVWEETSATSRVACECCAA